MNHTQTGILLLIAGLLASPAIGMTNQPPALQLAEAIAYGLEHSLSALQARTAENIAGTQIGQAASLALPQLSMEANYTRIDDVNTVESGDTVFSLGSPDNYEVRASVSQLLYAGGQVGAAWRAAQHIRELADARRRTTEATLIRDITTQFYGILLADAVVDVQQQSLDFLKSFEAQTRTRAGSGAASDFETLTARVRVANARPELIEARNQLALAEARFATLLHHPGPVTVTGSLAVADSNIDLPTMQVMALANRQELRSGSLLVELASEAIVETRSKALPSIRLFANYIGANPDQFTFEEEWNWRWNAGLAVSWDIWDGNLTRKTLQQRTFERQQQRQEYEQRKENILLQVRQAWLALQQAREALAASTESVQLAEQALDIARTRYETGLATYLELTDANLARSKARLTRLRARHDLAVALADVRFATGSGRTPPQQQENQP